MAFVDEIRSPKTETLASRTAGLSGATWVGISGIEGLTATQVQDALQQLAQKRHDKNHDLFSGDHPDVETADARQDGDTLVWRAAAGKYAHEPAVPVFSARSVLVVGGGAAQVWTDMPSATTEFRGTSANRFRLDPALGDSLKNMNVAERERRQGPLPTGVGGACPRRVENDREHTREGENVMNRLEQLKARKADLGREIERIRADRDYSEGAKARRIAPLYSRFKAEERRTLDEVRAETAQAAASKGRKAFEAPAMHGADRALVQMNYRHALDSVEGLTNPKDLDARLERAVLTGDSALARAAAYRANETGDSVTVTKYLDTDGDACRAYEEWADAHEELQKLNDFGAELAFGYAELEEPREVRHPEAKAEMAESSDAE